MAGTKPWTAARRHSFIVSVLRAGTRRWPAKYSVLNAAKTEKRINKKTGRMAQHYKCAKCKKDFPASAVSVDHINAVVGPEGFTTWDAFINNLFCEEDNLQVLCKTDHDKKSLLERGERNLRKNRTSKTSPREDSSEDS